MTFRTASICFAAIATLGIARLVTMDHAVSEIVSRPTRASRSVSPSLPSRDEMLWMTPDDWRKRFDQVSVPPQTRKAVTQLSADLQQFLATGADPRGEDADVYTNAILALLSSRGGE